MPQIPKRGTDVDSWCGTPVFCIPSPCDGNKARVFHRDHPGRVIAVFVGPDSWDDAKHFCALFGEPDGSKKLAETWGDKRYETGETVRGYE